MYRPLHTIVAGERRADRGAGIIPVLNPANDETLGELPAAGPADLDDALSSAARGFEAWRAVSPFDRGAVLRRAGQLLRDRADDLARLMTIEQGKPLAESRMEWAVTADILDWAAEEGRRTYGRVIPPRLADVVQTTRRSPVGPVAAFTPWNFPAMQPTQKLAPALAAGCSVIVKPAEETPASALALAEALFDAGLPDDVLNVVFGDPEMISTHLIASPVVRKVSFTGSIPVGKRLGAMAAAGVKRCTLELGGHAPVLVWADADVPRTADLAVRSKFRNAGQVCISPTRFYVHDSIYEPFVHEFASRTRELKVGDGLDPSTEMGPLANDRRLHAVDAMVQDALGKGARCETGGRRIGNVGNYLEPTVLADVPDDASVMYEEPFGPLAAMVRVDDLRQTIERANALPFGLAAYCFTNSSAVAHAVARDIEAGMLGINHFAIGLPEAPFGGVKESGYGAEGGTEGIDGYLDTRYVSHMTIADAGS